MNEELKTLMIFHVLCDAKSIGNANYAAFDENGELWWYTEKPEPQGTRWKNTSFAFDPSNTAGKSACLFDLCEFWKETLIEL